jgi:hypothetical protein
MIFAALTLATLALVGSWLWGRECGRQAVIASLKPRVWPPCPPPPPKPPEPVCERISTGKATRRVVTPYGTYVGDSYGLWFREETYRRASTATSNDLNDVWSGFEMRESVEVSP